MLYKNAYSLCINICLCLEQIMYCHRKGVRKHQAGHTTMAALRTVIVPLFVKGFRAGVRAGVRTTVRTRCS